MRHHMFSVKPLLYMENLERMQDMVKTAMLKKWAFLGILLSQFVLPSPGISQTFSDENPVIQIEKLRFFDWKSDASSQKIAKKACHIRLTGFSRDRVFISMQLSMLKASAAASARNALTILKISATQVFQEDFSDAIPIRLSEAWLETSTITTLGLLEKAINQEAHLVGGLPGNGLFITLLRGMRKDGLILGYHPEAAPFARVFDLGIPPPHLFEILKICLAKGAAVF